jgi:hypothetical protein
VTGYLGKTTNSPEDAVGKMAQGERETTWGPIPGRMYGYDAAKGTGSVTPLYKPIVAGKPLAIPDLLEVPLISQGLALLASPSLSLMGQLSC